jgi:hypothetical protein
VRIAIEITLSMNATAVFRQQPHNFWIAETENNCFRHISGAAQFDLWMVP